MKTENFKNLCVTVQWIAFYAAIATIAWSCIHAGGKP